MPASQISKPIFLHAAAQQAFCLAHRDCAIRLARSKIRRTPLSDYLKIAIACAHRITPFCSCGCSRGLPRASAATPLLPPPGYPRAPASVLVPPVYGYIRRIAAPRILPTAGDVAAVNVCPGGCVALYALRLHRIGRPSAAPAIIRRQTADGNTCRASSAGRVHRTAGHPRASCISQAPAGREARRGWLSCVWRCHLVTAAAVIRDLVTAWARRPRDLRRASLRACLSWDRTHPRSCTAQYIAASS